MYHPLHPKSEISNIKLFPVVLQTNSYLAPKTCFLMTALTFYRQQCPITLCHKSGDLIGLLENAVYIVRNPVFGVSDQVCHKPGCAITEYGYLGFEILDSESRGIVLSVKRKQRR